MDKRAAIKATAELVAILMLVLMIFLTIVAGVLWDWARIAIVVVIAGIFLAALWINLYREARD